MHIGVKLVDQGRHWHSCTVALGFVYHQPQVFAHPVDRKAKVKLVGHHGFATVVHLPALRCTFANHFQHLLHVQAGFHAKGNALGEALHQTSNANLVDHFGELSRTALAHQGESFGECHAHRLGALKSSGLAAAHDGQHAVDGASLTA